MDVSLMVESLPRLLGGVPTTLLLVGTSLCMGFVMALGLALMLRSRHWFLSAPAFAYVFVFRGTPMLIQIFFIYYGLAWWIGQVPDLRQSWLWPILREPIWYGIAALTLNTAAYGAEIIRGGLQSVPAGQIEAARACGMSRVLMFRRIVFPLALRQALPAYGNEIILTVKASALASTITIMEITGVAKAINSLYAAPFEIFIMAGTIYLAINFVAAQMVAMAERRLNPDRRPPR